MSTIHFSRIAWNVIQITLRVRFFVVDGRWNDARLKTQQADGQFNRSTRGSRMSQHTFGTGNRHIPRILTKCMILASVPTFYQLLAKGSLLILAVVIAEYQQTRA